ncbi:hypothetical protein [Maribacter halichondriae]|uniref:hypothetical protein n=1 Tax=Maribacter halichondriae TaxID=2980554 RepID=UPI0023597FFA|nr:hypothetical protein [Maribacter sp. Hal144]
MNSRGLKNGFFENGPNQNEKLQISLPNKKDDNWMYQILNRECAQFGTKARWESDGALSII